MKNIKKYFGLTLLALFITAFSGCKEDDEFGSDNVGLGIKVFSPTKVVPGQPVTINGSGFGDVTEVEFPGGISVSNFELVSNEMIRVVTPKGINIAPEGEKLIVRTSNGKAESAHLMTQGHTQPRTCSAEPGEDVKAKSILKIFGQDMEFVNKATFIKSDDEIIELSQKDFYRIATNSLAIKIPTNVKEGKQIASIETLDGKKFDLPEYNYVAAATGHWEITKKMLWENPDPTGNGAVSWNSLYRIGLEGNDGNNECITTLDAATWDIIKNGEVCFLFDGSSSSNVRITTGWWTGAYGNVGDEIEHNSIDLAVEDEETGKMVITLNIKEDGNLYDNLDAQHLLFTGDAYTPLALYVIEQTWVEDAEGHWERKSLWKNDGTSGEINWNGKYRFGLEGNDGNNECIATFDADTWALIKEGKVYVSLDCNESSNIRITTGWWTGAYGNVGDEIEHNSIDMVEDDAATGKKVIKLNIKEDGNLYDNIDAQHLLFTGDGYTPLKIYYIK